VTLLCFPLVQRASPPAARPGVLVNFEEEVAVMEREWEWEQDRPQLEELWAESNAKREFGELVNLADYRQTQKEDE